MIAYKGLSLKVTLTAVLCIMGVSFLTVGDPKAPKAQDADFENIPAPDEKGPYDVGIRTFEMVPMSAGRLTRIQVFYPTDPIDPTFDPTDCPNTYTLSTFGGSLQRSSPLCAVPNATAAAGPFPLVVFDHGGDQLGGDRLRCSQLPLNETLASHGFVVVLALHPADIVAQVRDLSLVIDYMLGRNTTAGDVLFGRIDPDRIGLNGTSGGGRNSLRVAGGWPLHGLAADPRIKAMVQYEAGELTAEVLADASAISIPYLAMGGNRFRNGLVIPDLLDATVLATPRIHVLNPEALHFSWQTSLCASIDEAREAALVAYPTLLPEPLTNMIKDPAINPQTGECFKIPGTDTCRRICNTNINIDPDIIPDPIIRANIRAAAVEACFWWNRGELAFTAPSEVNTGGGRNFCTRIGTNPNSARSLDTDGDGFTDSPPFLANDDFPFLSNDVGTPMPQEVLVPMMKLYTVAFFKKFLAGDGRYMRYLTPGYAIVNDLEAVVTIIGEEEVTTEE